MTSKSWSFRSLVSSPIFNGGAGTACVGAARVRYDQALVSYRSKVHQAVQEVEDTLVCLDASERRVDVAVTADTQYAKVLEAPNACCRLGAGSLLWLEDVRRIVLQISRSLAAARLERAQAWVTLYKAAGGGQCGDTPNSHPDRKTIAPTAQGRAYIGNAL